MQNSRYDKYMDKEMIPICNALNRLKGIRTTFCCCGHNSTFHFYITMNCSSIKSLKSILRCFDNRVFNIEVDHIGPLGDKPTEDEISVRIDFLKRSSKISKEIGDYIQCELNRAYVKLCEMIQ